MELERRISESIRLEELKPIQWEKDRVWNSIQREIKSTGYSIYFIAASIALACCLIFYFVRPNLYQNKLINAIQKSNLDQCNLEAQKTAIEESSEPTENCDHGIILYMQIAKRNENPLVSIPSITLKPMRDSINTAKVETLILDSIDAPSLAGDELLTASPPKIEAIIGVIPAEQKHFRVAKEKKLRIKFSRDHYEFFSDDDPKKPVLTARIN